MVFVVVVNVDKLPMLISLVHSNKDDEHNGVYLGAGLLQSGKTFLSARILFFLQFCNPIE